MTQAPKNLVIDGQKIYLRPVQPSDATTEYLSWLNDPDVTRFTESRFARYKMEDIRAYIRQTLADPAVLFMAIISKDEQRHVGNIKLGPIHPHHRHADIGFIIGDKSSWGKGFATEAIRLLSDHALQKMDVLKVTAGCYGSNVGSMKALIRAGFRIEGVREKHYLSDGILVDGISFGKRIEQGSTAK